MLQERLLKLLNLGIVFFIIQKYCKSKELHGENNCKS